MEQGIGFIIKAKQTDTIAGIAMVTATVAITKSCHVEYLPDQFRTHSLHNTYENRGMTFDMWCTVIKIWIPNTKTRSFNTQLTSILLSHRQVHIWAFIRLWQSDHPPKIGQRRFWKFIATSKDVFATRKLLWQKNNGQIQPLYCYCINMQVTKFCADLFSINNLWCINLMSLLQIMSSNIIEEILCILGLHHSVTEVNCLKWSDNRTN